MLFLFLCQKNTEHLKAIDRPAKKKIYIKKKFCQCKQQNLEKTEKLNSLPIHGKHATETLSELDF